MAYVEADHQVDDDPVNPRWIDQHFPDYRLIRWLGHSRRLRKPRSGPAGRIDRWLAGYCLRFVHCPRDGQCALRAGHRGGCAWSE